MVEHNSLSDYIALVVELIHDIASRYPGTRIEAARCCDYVTRRATSEGLRFLTDVLPSFGRAVDTALSKEMPLTTPHLRKRKGCSTPLFLWWLTERIFDSEGHELSNSCSESVRHMRQILYFMYKVPVPYEQQSKDRVIRSFVETDEELSQALPSDVKSYGILSVARDIIHRVTGNIQWLDIEPCHGPGAVATGERPWEKYHFKRHYNLSSRLYPPDRFFYWGASHLCDELDLYLKAESISEPTAKVVLVPKDSRGPRLISCEPLEIQYLQQGLKNKLQACIEGHRLCKGHVNFTDQTINRRLAQQGSRDRSLVTLDMKDASDRVSLQLVAALFPHGLCEALYALRSTQTKLPDGKVVRLNKFAPMGSALCFPVESIVFYALCVSSLVIHRGYSLRKACRRVWVYGDDIVCYGEDYPVVLSSLPAFGLKFNEKKCCTHGSFRESCGGDYHKGNFVTPLRLRKVLSSRSSPATMASLVDLSNRLWCHGYTRCATVIQRFFEKHRIPYVDCDIEKMSCIAFAPSVRMHEVHTSHSPRRRFNKRLQRLELYVPTIGPRVCKFPVSAWREMSRVVRTYKPFHPLHVCEGLRAGYYTVPHRVSLKMRWIPATDVAGT